MHVLYIPHCHCIHTFQIWQELKQSEIKNSNNQTFYVHVEVYSSMMSVLLIIRFVNGVIGENIKAYLIHGNGYLSPITIVSSSRVPCRWRLKYPPISHSQMKTNSSCSGLFISVGIRLIRGCAFLRSNTKTNFGLIYVVIISIAVLLLNTTICRDTVERKIKTHFTRNVVAWWRINITLFSMVEHWNPFNWQMKVFTAD